MPADTLTLDKPTSDVAFTPAVKALQTRHGSRDAYARMESKGAWTDVVTDKLAEFLAQRDSFYLGTASADGQPYIQHRGGKPGFLKVLDQRTLAFPDYGGNRQYISTGNLSENDKAYIFLMDYANKQRLKIWAEAEVLDPAEHPKLAEQLIMPNYEANVERIFVFKVHAFDWNCPQHITPRYTEEEIQKGRVKLDHEMVGGE